MTYPNTAGYTNKTTSKESAKKIDIYRKAKLMYKIEDLLKYFVLGMTGDEVAIYLKENLISIRARITELSKNNVIVDSDMRRKNTNNRNVIVWVHKDNIERMFK